MPTLPTITITDTGDLTITWPPHPTDDPTDPGAPTTSWALDALADPDFWDFTATHAITTRRHILPGCEIDHLMARLIPLAKDIARALTDAQGDPHP